MINPTFQSVPCPEPILDTLQVLLPPFLSVRTLLEYGIFAGGAVAYAIQYTHRSATEEALNEMKALLSSLKIYSDVQTIIFDYSICNDDKSTQQQFYNCSCAQWNCVFCRDPRVFKAECNDVDLFVSPENARRALNYVVQTAKSSVFHIRTKDSSLTECEFPDINGAEVQPSGMSVISICFEPPVKPQAVQFPYHYKPLQLVCWNEESAQNLMSRFDFDYVQCAIVQCAIMNRTETKKRKRKNVQQSVPTLIRSTWNVEALSSLQIRFMKDNSFGVSRFQSRVRKALRKGFTFINNTYILQQCPYALDYFFECHSRPCDQSRPTTPCHDHPFYAQDEETNTRRMGPRVPLETIKNVVFVPILDLLGYMEKERDPSRSPYMPAHYVDLAQSSKKRK